MGWEEQYEVVAELRANGRVPVTKYRSRRSGLTVTLAQVSWGQNNRLQACHCVPLSARCADIRTNYVPVGTF